VFFKSPARVKILKCTILREICPKPFYSIGDGIMTDRLQEGQQLNSNDKLVSSNGRYILWMQPDGNLVLYHDWIDASTAYWATDTWGQPDNERPTYALMQKDAHFVLYDVNDVPRWASGTWGPGYVAPYIVLQDDGNLVIFHDGTRPVWASGGVGGAGAIPGQGHLPAGGGVVGGPVIEMPFEPATFVLPQSLDFGVHIISGIVPISPTTAPETLARLQHHKAVLESFGVNDLSLLGKLAISGNVVPQAGLLKPADEIYETSLTIFQSARRFIEQGTAFEAIGGTARLLKTVPFPTAQPPIDTPTESAEPLDLEPGTFIPVKPKGSLLPGIPPGGVPENSFTPRPLSLLSGTVSISDAYWAATWIDIADNTVIVFKQPNMYLTIITEKLTVGNNVTFTWEKTPPASLPVKFAKPPKKPQAATPNGIWGNDGEAGTPGQVGGRAPDGKDAPELELWTLEMTGRPKFDLKGQGWVPEELYFQGGVGQDGGDGGDGSKGRDNQGYWSVPIQTPLGQISGPYICTSGPGNGGAGGHGGMAGNGGQGGNGGHGGRLSLYAPQPVLNVYAQGFYATVDGGAAGPGGMPGNPGTGGNGGQVGDNPQNCPPKSGKRTAGEAGKPGEPGKQGPAGQPGAKYEDEDEDAVGLKPIDADDFRRKLLEPVIFRLSPTDGREGDTVTATGLRYTATDVVFVDDVACATTIVNDTQLTFKVPSVPGGRRAVQVKQTDGTLSNRATLDVLPVIGSMQPTGRIRPGTRVTVVGSGFAPGSIVRVNEQDMPDVRYINANTLEFTLIRPAVITANPAGEDVILKVVLPQGTPSNEILLVLDTFRMLVLGDSVLWGQGLQENQKIHTLVKQAIQQREGNIGVYSELLAHSGATIGISDNDVEDTQRLPSLDGEVPTNYPTILQQCDDFNNKPETVDLIIVNGGINDVNARRILNPLNSEAFLRGLAEKHCHQHMKTLLERITNKFKKAKVIVTGYYPMISEDSDLLLLEAFLIGIGLEVASITGGIIGAVIGPAMKSAIAANCQFFAEQSEMKLQAAVDDVNSSLINSTLEPEARVFLAVPDFDKKNAALAPEPWLYAINLDFSSQDNLVAGGRKTACEQAGSGRTDVEICKRASIGHPNAVGAEKYAAEIIARLSSASFPPNFLWGVGTAAYQVEGSIENNDWHIFTTSPAIKRRVAALSELVGLSYELEAPGVAVRHSDINVLKEDLDRTKLLGMNAYRFSLEWSRIQPTPDTFDPVVLQYYDDAIAEMQKRGLKPIVTLNHLTLPDWVLTPPRESSITSAIGIPIAIEDDAFRASLQGWEDDRAVEAFNTFVNVVVGRYKNQVDTWITLNEPAGSMIGLGYIGGIWPPGFSLDGVRAKKAYFNLLKAHVRAYETIKSLYGSQLSRVGIAHAMLFPRLTTAGGGIGNVNEAAKNQFNYFYNEHFLDSLISDVVDTEIQRRPADRVNVSSQAFYNLPSSEVWKPKLDFIGLNYYRSVYVSYDQILAMSAGFSGGTFDNDLSLKNSKHYLLNDLGWEIYPKGLYFILKRLHELYGLPILITENGIPQSVDWNRAPFVVSHLQQILRAIQEGVQVDGYIHWSIVDNFEWQVGYDASAQFGLFTVDRRAMDANGNQTLPRHITEGALALQYIIAENGIGQAVERFGAFSAKGYRVSPPSKSAGATWEGAFGDGSGFTLYLSHLVSNAQWLGMIFLHKTNTWHRLEAISVSGSVLRFSQSISGGGGRTYEATSIGGRLTGTFNENGVSQTWQAGRVLPAGNWKSTGMFPEFVHFRRMEGAFDQMHGKLLGMAWVGCNSFTWDGTTLSFGIGGVGDFSGGFSGDPDTISGTMALVGGGGGATATWEARRLTDDITF
jgi:beta-glucosidase/6-phospho-beta-glucosidase/beta-galactosidase/lysophospholipase L1-like esterase